MKAETPCRKQTNANDGGDCADEIDKDDGRVTFGPSEDHKGDWGRHRKENDIDGASDDKKGGGSKRVYASS